MDTGLVQSAILSVVRISAFAVLCWGGWMLYSYNFEETEPAQDLSSERVGLLVLFALLWSALEGLAR